MRLRRRRVAVGVGLVLIVVVAALVLIELTMPTAVIPRARYQCAIRNMTAQPVAVVYRQSNDNTWHTAVQNHRWLDPGEKQAFNFSRKDIFLVGYASDDEFSSIGADLSIERMISPRGHSAFQIVHGVNDYPQFKEIVDDRE